MGRGSRSRQVLLDDRQYTGFGSLETRSFPRFANWALMPLTLLFAIASCFIRERALVVHQVRASQVDAGPAPWLLVNVLVAAEDHRFLTHRGVDYFAFLRAGWVCAWMPQRQGGSTIEQQLSRTITGDRSMTIQRKVKDACLAAHLCRMFTKEELANAYLRLAYFGFPGSGYIAASQELELHRLHASLGEASFLVAHLKYPARRGNRSMGAVLARAEWIRHRFNKMQ